MYAERRQTFVGRQVTQVPPLYVKRLLTQPSKTQYRNTAVTVLCSRCNVRPGCFITEISRASSMPARDQKLESSFSSPQYRSPVNLGQIRTATTALLLTSPTSQQRSKTQELETNRNQVYLDYTRNQRRGDKNNLVVSISTAPTKKLSPRILPTTSCA